MSALQRAERTKNQEWLAGGGSLMEPLKGETVLMKVQVWGGVVRVCLIPVRATCRLKPVASVEDIRA